MVEPGRHGGPDEKPDTVIGTMPEPIMPKPIMPAPTVDPPTTRRPTLHHPTALTLLRRSEHVLFGVLLIIGTVAAWTGRGRWWVLAGALLVGCWYLIGIVLAARSRRRWQAYGWLLILVLGCAALALGSVGYVWLAFPLFLLCMQLLPSVAAVTAVVLITAGAITAVAVDRGQIDAAAVIGPVVGAAVAVVITEVYRDLAEQVRQRAALIEQLTATRDQLAASERAAGVLAERERLSREIHDTVAQSLTSIMLLLRSVRDSGQAFPPQMRDQLDGAIAGAGSALSDTRRLVHDLTPTELSGRSLPEAISRVAREYGDPPVGLRVEGEPFPVATPVAVALLRGVQEALANVRSHARAGRVEVTLTYLAEAISLDVVDDGVGFDPAAPIGPGTGSGLGLPGMRSRMADVGGSLVIESAPGRGAAVSMVVPVKDVDHD